MIATGIAAGCVLTSCSSTVQGNGVAAAPEIDIASLDTGDFPTDPSPPFGTVDSNDPVITDLEGQRMAEFVTIPFEVVPGATDPDRPTAVIRSAASLQEPFGGREDMGAASSTPEGGLISGFVATGSTVAVKNSDPKTTITEMVLRYVSPAAATAAAQAMHDVSHQPAAEFTRAFAPATVPELPASLASTWSYAGGDGVVGGAPSSGLSVFTPHNAYVIYTNVSVPTQDAGTLPSIVNKALSLQLPLIDQFPPTPTRSQNGGVAPTIQIDQNNILIYAIPNTDEYQSFGTNRAVYGPRGLALQFTDPALVLKTLQDVGSDHNATWKTTVTRAKTEDGAKKIINDFVNSDLSLGSQRDDSPKNLPIAQCVVKDETIGQVVSCYVQVGRYVGQLTDLDKTTVDQAISAQYVILTKADQNAE
ncbi:hypothetical protein ACNHUS_25520 [Actinomycetes bacterium M1A6_2h]